MVNSLNTLNSEELETDDIYQAAYYNIAGCEFRRKRKEGHKVYFVFMNPAGSMKEIREQYFNGKAKVSAYDYSKEVKRFKELCFDGR